MSLVHRLYVWSQKCFNDFLLYDGYAQKFSEVIHCTDCSYNLTALLLSEHDSRTT